MKFIHDDAEFESLLRIVAAKHRLRPGLVEKDYWVTHTLWALQDAGLDIWFKGGTSLSKGFGLIQRFSEDLDLRVEAGRVDLPSVANWARRGTGMASKRKAFFDALIATVVVPGAMLQLDAEHQHRGWRLTRIKVLYPGIALGDLKPPMKAYVLLEVNNVGLSLPVMRPITSFVHDEIARLGKLDAYVENRPRNVLCIHPIVTLLDKLDAISKRARSPSRDAATFVRHYEDAAQIINAISTLPKIVGYANIPSLARAMVAKKQLRRLPMSDDPAFALPPGAATDAVIRAYDAIGAMFWGKRMPLDVACRIIRAWINLEFEQ